MGNIFRGRQPRLWANHQVGGQPSLSPHNIIETDEESRVNGTTRGWAAAGTQAPPTIRSRSTCCPPPPRTRRRQRRDIVSQTHVRRRARWPVGEYAQNRASRRLRAPVVPRPLMLQPATDRSDRGRSCVLVRVSRRICPFRSVIIA